MQVGYSTLLKSYACNGERVEPLNISLLYLISKDKCVELVDIFLETYVPPSCASCSFAIVIKLFPFLDVGGDYFPAIPNKISFKVVTRSS